MADPSRYRDADPYNSAAAYHDPYAGGAGAGSHADYGAGQGYGYGAGDRDYYNHGSAFEDEDGPAPTPPEKGRGTMMADEYAAAGEKGLAPSNNVHGQYADTGMGGRKGNSIWTPQDRSSFRQGGPAARLLRSRVGVGCAIDAQGDVLLSRLHHRLIIGIVCSVILFLRPPNVAFNGLTLPANPVSTTADGFSLNVTLNIGISNPNSIGADIKELQADIFYPLNGNKTQFGNGDLSNINIKPNSNTTINFPFQVQYSTAIDPSRTLITDIGTKCIAKQDLTVDYTITPKLHIIAVDLAPSVSGSASFKCPLTSDIIDKFLGGAAGGGLAGLAGAAAGAAGGLSGRSGRSDGAQDGAGSWRERELGE